MILLVLFIHLPVRISAGWSSSTSSGEQDLSMYGISMQRDWLYGASSIAIKYEGCVMGQVDDREDAGCMDDESEDGTSSWYMMANCRRAQVAYSVYATESGTTSCSNNDFQESLMTKTGVAEFATTMGYYGYNSPMSEDDVGDLPMCEEDGYGYYLGVGCAEGGGFTIDRFLDAYCLQRYNSYETLTSFNTLMTDSSLKCFSAYNPSDNESPYVSLSNYLIPDSGGCSSTESQYCTSSDFVTNSGSSRGFQTSNTFKSQEVLSLTNKLKYGLGGTMLAGSVVMFFGILFTNRRKRRALMHRKFRSGPASRSKSRKADPKSSGTPRSKRKKKRDGASSTVKANNDGVMA